MSCASEAVTRRPWSRRAGWNAREIGHWSPRLSDPPTIRPVDRPFFATAPCFAALDEDRIAALRQIAVRRTFENDQTIHGQGEEIRFLDVVVAGHVRLSYLMEDGSTVLHTILPAGESFGEVGVLERCAHLDMAVAAGPVALMSFPTASLLDLAAQDAELSQALRSAAAARGRDYIALIRTLSLPSLQARLAQVLIRIADRIGGPVLSEGRPALKIGSVVSQGDLALMARGSRGNVNRTMQAWQRAGWIAVEGRSILVLNRAALAAVVRNGEG